MARKPTGSELVNETATASPRAGFLGVLPVDEIPDYGQGAYVARLKIVVECPDCTNMATIEGDVRRVPQRDQDGAAVVRLHELQLGPQRGKFA